MTLADVPLSRLSIARDDDKMIIARDPPLINGHARRATTGSITDIVAVPRRLWTSCHSPAGEWARSTVSESAPGTAPALVGLIIGFIVAMIATLGVSRALTPWLGVPLGLIITATATAGALLQQDRAERRWRDGHHVLYHLRDRHALHRGRAAVQQIADAWPELGTMVDVPDPTPALAQALWELASVLAHRQTVRRTRDELVQATNGLPSESRVRREVTTRREHADAELAGVDREAARRLTYLTGLADECSRFVHEQQALTHARTAVRRADAVLSRAMSVAAGGNGGEELAERTRAVLTAYRELTSHLGVDDI